MTKHNETSAPQGAIAKLGTKIERLLNAAKRFEERAAESRHKARDLKAQFDRMVNEAAGESATDPMPRRRQRQASVSTPGETTVSGRLKDWAFQKGQPFQYSEAKAFLRAIRASDGHQLLGAVAAASYTMIQTVDREPRSECGLRLQLKTEAHIAEVFICRDHSLHSQFLHDDHARQIGEGDQRLVTRMRNALRLQREDLIDRNRQCRQKLRNNPAARKDHARVVAASGKMEDGHVAAVGID